ncbi:MAG: chemotaxis protein CheC [Myxococcota bacterium]
MNVRSGAFFEAFCGLMEHASSRALGVMLSMVEKGGLELKKTRLVSSETLAQVSDLERASVVVRFRVTGEELDLGLYCVFSEWAAADLVGRLLAGIRSGVDLQELETSALAELANIKGSAFVDAASETLGCCLLPSPPQPMSGVALEAVSAGIPPKTVVATSRFESPPAGIEGRYLLCADRDNAFALAARLGVSPEQVTRDLESLFS